MYLTFTSVYHLHNQTDQPEGPPPDPTLPLQSPTLCGAGSGRTGHCSHTVWVVGFEAAARLGGSELRATSVCNAKSLPGTVLVCSGLPCWPQGMTELSVIQWTPQPLRPGCSDSHRLPTFCAPDSALSSPLQAPSHLQ